MNLQKITNIVSWTLGLLGLLFLFILIFQGDDSIEANAMQGNYGFVSLIIGGSIISSIGGSFLLIPESVSIVVVTRKNINSKKAISAIEPALTSGADLLDIIIF